MSLSEIRALKEIKCNKGLNREDFYATLKPSLDEIIFPNGASRGVYYNYYTNRSN